MAELVDASDSKSGYRKVVQVRFLFRAHSKLQVQQLEAFFILGCLSDTDMLILPFMGLDIFISTDIDIMSEAGLRSSLSRIFLRLIFRQHDQDDDEINQISEISGIDLSSLLEMNIPDTSYLEFQLDSIEDGQERQKIKDEITQIREKFSKDINVVIDTLQKLDEKLKAKPDYFQKIRLTNPPESFINYFKNYSVDIEPNKYGFVSDNDTNFGVDIRGLLRYLTFARSQGAVKTYFSFG